MTNSWYLPLIQVKLKRYLEMRGADGGPWRSYCALPAFWVISFTNSSLISISLAYAFNILF